MFFFNDNASKLEGSSNTMIARVDEHKYFSEPLFSYALATQFFGGTIVSLPECLQRYSKTIVHTLDICTMWENILKNRTVEKESLYLEIIFIYLRETFFNK